MPPGEPTGVLLEPPAGPLDAGTVLAFGVAGEVVYHRA